MIPAQAFGLKKYRCGTGPASRISDNEHTPASLRDSPSKPVHSHVLSVKHSVGEPIPEFAQAPEEGAKVPSSVAGQDAGDVFPNQPLGAIAVSDGKIGECEVAPRVSQSLAKARDRERLAGRAGDESIDSCIRPFLETGQIAQVRDAGVVVRQHGRREAVHLGEGPRFPAERTPSDACRLNAAAPGEIAERRIWIGRIFDPRYSAA
jgi:hypothetical protein